MSLGTSWSYSSARVRYFSNIVFVMVIVGCSKHQNEELLPIEGRASAQLQRMVGTGAYRRVARMLTTLESATTATNVRAWAAEHIHGARQFPVGSKAVTIPDRFLPSVLIESFGKPLFASANIGREHSEDYVAVAWGGGLGFEGLLIGDEGFRPPPNYLVYAEWEPGVYIWHSAR